MACWFADGESSSSNKEATSAEATPAAVVAGDEDAQARKKVKIMSKEERDSMLAALLAVED